MIRKLLSPLLNHVRLNRLRKKDIHIARGTFIHPRTKIGKGTRINAASHLGECTIGAYCAFGGRLIVRSSNHHTNYLNMQDYFQKVTLGSSVRVAGKSKGSINIGNAVWIGDSVIVLPGANIGDGAVIGAGSVVTKPIPSFAIAAGNPAKVIKMRFPDDIIALLRNVRWWEWDDKKLIKNRQLFETDLNAISAPRLRELLAGSEKKADRDNV